MSKVGAVVLASFAVFAVGAVVSVAEASASVEPVWVVKGATLKAFEASTVSVKFGKLTFKWEDKSTGTKFEAECKKTSGKMELKGGDPGTDKVQSLAFKECVLVKGGGECGITFGGVTAEGLPGWSTELVISGGDLYDLATGITFSLILEGCEKVSFNKTWLFKGDLESEVKNGTEKVKIVYPASELGDDTLESEGAKAQLSGEGELEKEGGALQVGEESVGGGHQWLRNGAALTQEEPVSSEGGLFLVNAAGKEIDCETVHDVTDLKIGDSGIALDIHFLNCKTAAANCLVNSPGAAGGLILVSNIPILAVEVETSTGVKKPGVEFKENATTHEFVTLDFTPDVAGACSNYGTSTKVKGTINAEANNTTEELIFPNPELEGNTLELFGVAAGLFGKDKQKLTNGGELHVD